jgi:hypothetical protein
MRVTSWKTTLIGAILAIVVAVQPLIATGKIDWKAVVMAALIAGLGYVAKDSDVTGGTKTLGSPMKKLFMIVILITGFSIANAQVSLTKPIPKNWSQLVNTDNNKLATVNSLYKWVPRLNGGIQGLSYDLKGNEPKTLNAICFGVGWLRYKDVDGVPFNDFGVNLLLLIDTQTKGYGLGIYGTYNLIGSTALVNIGTHYDFNLKTELIDTGLTFHY